MQEIQTCKCNRICDVTPQVDKITPIRVVIKKNKKKF